MRDGSWEGPEEALIVGRAEGEADGTIDATNEGDEDCISEGISEDLRDGSWEGPEEALIVGRADGTAEATTEGNGEGGRVADWTNPLKSTLTKYPKTNDSFLRDSIRELRRLLSENTSRVDSSSSS